MQFLRGEISIPENHVPISDSRHSYHDNNNQRIYKSLSPSESCSTPVTDSERSSDSCSRCSPPYYVADTLMHHSSVPHTTELADTNNSNSARSRNESHLTNCSRYVSFMYVCLVSWNGELFPRDRVGDRVGFMVSSFKVYIRLVFVRNI